MKRIIKTAVYACSYCNEQFNTPKEASKHEDICEHRPSLALRQHELQLRKERTEAIEKMYQAETITELDKLWYEFIKTYHKSAYSSFTTSISLSKNELYSEFKGYRIEVKPIRYPDVNHQIDMSLSKFPKIIEKIEKLEQVKNDYTDNYDIQYDNLNKKELELQLSDEEHQCNLKIFNSLTEEIRKLNSKLKVVKEKLEISRVEKHKQAKELIGFIDYFTVIKHLKSDLGIN